MIALEDPMRLLAGDNIMRRAMAWTVVFAICWAALEIVLGAYLHAPYSLFQIVWCRYAVHLCIVLLVWGWRRPEIVWSTSRPVSHLFRSFLMIIMPCSFAFAVQRGIPAEFVWSVFWIAPALIIIFASGFLKERPPLAIVIVSVTGAIAATAIFGHFQPPSLNAIVLALAVAASFSLYVVMTRSLRHQALEANMFYTAIVPFIMLTPVQPGVWLWPDLHDAIVMVLIGAVGFVALIALDESCRVAPAWCSAGALFVQALCAAIFVAVLSGVAPGFRVASGMVTVAAIFGILWLRADRFALQAGLEPSRA